jgi:serine/threonine-protein kinase RsbW
MGRGGSVGEPQQIGGAGLSVQVSEVPPYLVAQWSSAGQDATGETAAAVSRDLLGRPGERFVLDLGQLGNISDGVARALAACIVEAQREGKDVCLVRCSGALYRRLQSVGVTDVSHAGSLVSATQGMAEENVSTLELHLRSTPDLLRRLREVVSVLAQETELAPELEHQIKTAVTEAAANAILHGSPEGARNRVHVSFHLHEETLIVDVADQGPGFEPERVPPPAPQDLVEHGYGLHMIRQSMDRVEFFRDGRGMLVRMTKRLSPATAEWVQ